MGNQNSQISCIQCSCVLCKKRSHVGAHPTELNQFESHKVQSTSWIPPKENWDPSTGLPYGWETGVDKNNKPYFINHVDKYTTRDDPRDDADYVEPPKPREVELFRDTEKGFGFVAGSEKPVVVRFVTEGGPSVDKLLPGDLILKINREEVRKAPREKVIELVRACKQSIVLTVCQPYSDNSSIKSALLTAAKKAKLKSNPSRVRFAESVMVNGAHVLTPSIQESYVPFMPNVLKVFLENGQTKSFKYDNKTTVKDVMTSLHEKLNISCIQYFSLVLQNMKNNTAGKMTLLQEDETLIDIAARPGARHFRCLYRVTFVPKDAYDLLKEDAIAFEYFYLQCCNDIINERFTSELKYDTTLRLAALQIQQHAMSNNMSGKISIKSIEKECGLERFVPHSLLEHMKGKDLRKMLNQYLKQNQSLTAPGQKQLTALQAKLHYMKIVSELKTFGSRVFMVTLLDKKTEAMVLVGPKSGISVVTNIKTYQMGLLADFDQLGSIKVTKEGDNMQRVDINTTPDKLFSEQTISLGLLTEDAQNFVCMVAGYYSIFVQNDSNIVERTQGKNTSDPDVLAYSNIHRVVSAPWSYPEDLVSEVIVPGEAGDKFDNERLVDLSKPVPEYVENKEFLSRISIYSKKSEETEPLIISTDKAEVSSLSSANINGTLYEESVTSFSANSSHDDSSDNGSINTSMASQNGHAFSLLSSDSSRTVINGSTSNVKQTLSYNNNQTYLENANLSLRSDEAPSDTDSGSGIDIERKPLLPNSGYNLQNGDLRNGFDIECDDTDSWGTPQNSPAKSKFGHAPTSLPADNFHSFGLHSPNVPPGIDIHVEDFAASMGLPASDIITPDLGNIMEPQGVYLDPDIIDLTLIPPPLSSDDESMIDFTLLSANSCFSSTSKLGVVYSNSSETGSPGTKKSTISVSVSNCPDLLGNDIDALIARFTVPPPPSENRDSVNTSTNTITDCNNIKDWTDSTSHLLQDFSKLIIPPPPSLNTPTDEEIVIVPLVNETKQQRKLFRHKRSSSIDIGSLQKAKELLFDKSNSLDSNIAMDGAQRFTDPPASFNDEFYPVSGTVAESPATVSEKLNKLLQSLPRVGYFSEIFVRTGSLRLSRSSSLDVAKDNVPPPPFVRTSSLRSGKSIPIIQQRSSSLDIKTKSPKIEQVQLISKAHSFDSIKNESKDNASTMASIKAQLQSCRDMLLSKSNRSSKSLYSSDSSNLDYSTSDDSSTSENVSRRESLKRSNSFTQLINQLSKNKCRNSKSSSASTSPILTNYTTSESSDVEKKAPTVLESLPLPKTLRPVSTASNTQSKLKKSGPVKALGTSVYATNEKISDVKGSHLKNKEEHSKKSKKHGSKDDSLIDTAGKIKWKANPYATIKMWRPITMSTSITSENDVYQNFTNFQNLQELPDSLESKEPVFHGNTNGNVTYSVKLNSHILPLSIAISEEMQHEAPRPCRQQSVSENSYNIISLSATDSVKEVLAKLYTTDDFENVNMDIDRFLTELKYTLESLQNSRIDKDYTQFNFYKEELITQTKQFINDAKLLVSSANNTQEKLAHYLNMAMHTLANLFLHSQSVMLMMESIHSAQNLGLEVIKVSHAFKSTVTAARAAVGKPLADPHMKYLMRQAVNLAGLLSVLLKGLRVLQSIEN